MDTRPDRQRYQADHRLDVLRRAANRQKQKEELLDKIYDLQLRVKLLEERNK